MKAMSISFGGLDIATEDWRVWLNDWWQQQSDIDPKADEKGYKATASLRYLQLLSREPVSPNHCRIDQVNVEGVVLESKDDDDDW